jgi:hypothetical protein
MKKAFLSFALTTTILGAFTYCSKKEDPTPLGYTPIEQQTTSVTGFVKAQDQFDVPLQLKSGFTVSIMGTTFSATTDQYGKFAIANVKVGAYKMSISNAGFSTLEYPFYVSAPGNGNQPDAMGTSSIKQTSDLNIISVTSAINNCYSSPYSSICDTVLQIRSLISSTTGSALSTGSKNFIAFISTDIKVSKDNYLYTMQGASIDTSNTGVISNLDNYNYSYNYKISYIKSTYGFKSGQKLYIVLHEYSGVLNGNSYYYNSTNETTGLTEYPTINPTPSDVTYVILP